MLSHPQIWTSIDTLAERQGVSVSRLAREAGLDPTTFNKSKRVSSDGRLRWPSTESLSKIMMSTGISVEDFLGLARQAESHNHAQMGVMDTLSMGEGSGFNAPAKTGYVAPASLPLLGIAQAGAGGFFDEAGLPTGEGWDAVEFPHSLDETVYALEISGDSMMPLYRDGDRILVSPTSSLRRGDRVVVRTLEGEVMAKVLARKTAMRVELQSLNPEHADRQIDLSQIDWIARIIWASQ